MADEAVTLTAVTGNSMTNTITFTSASADSSKVSVISTTGNTFNITDVDYVTFTHLTLGYNGASGNTVYAYSTDISFDQVKIDHDPINGGTAIYVDRDAGVNNFMFTNSDLFSTTTGIYLGADLSDVNTVTFTNANLSSMNRTLEIYAEKSLVDVTITGSYFYSNSSDAADLQGYYTKIENVTIDNSEFQGGAAYGSGNYAFYMYSDYIIENVDIDNSIFYAPNSDAVYMGADYTRINNVDINNTNIWGLNKGLELYSDVTTSNISLNNDTIMSNPDDSLFSGDDAVYIEGNGFMDMITITNSYLTTPMASGNGGYALEMYSGSNQINNVTIGNNDLNSYDGVYIYAETSGDNWMIDANTINSENSYGLDLEPYYGSGIDIMVTNNTINSSDDGIYMYSDGVLKDVTIDANIINSDDDGMYCSGYYGGMENFVITNNKDTASGEGIYLYTDAKLKNCDVSDNTVITDSYGIDLEGYYGGNTDFTINDNLVECSSTGIYIYGDVNATNIEITGNDVDADSEALYIYSSDANIENVQVEDNILLGSSEGVYIYADALANNISFLNNDITSTGSEGVYIEGYYAGVENTEFKNNDVDAQSDWGIYIYSYASVKNTTLIDSNHVVSQDPALGIMGEYGGIEGVNIDNSYFEGEDYYSAVIIADYVHIKDLSIKNSTFVGDTIDNSDCPAMRLECDDAGMENIEIVNNKIYSSNSALLMEADYGNAKNTNIDNNQVWANDYGIMVDGIGDSSAVTNNIIFPMSGGSLDYGISTSGFDGSSVVVNISGNTINDVNDEGVYLEYSGDVTINNNYVRSVGNGSTYGVYAYYASGAEINGNQVLLDDGSVGVYTSYSNGTLANPLMVTNNFVSGCDYAIDVEDADHVNVYHNSVSSNTNNTNNLIYFSSASNVNFNNNIVKADSAASGTIYYCSSCNNINTDNNVFDFDSTTVDMASDAYFGTNTSLFDMQTNTSFDAGSFMADPMFVNDTTDLHISCSNNALVVAPFMAAVPNDVDGAMRNTTTTTIGAHEITPSGADILPATLEICNVGTIVPNTTGASYLWTPGGATTPTLTVTTAGTYYLQLTDYCGNVYNDSIVVTEDLPVASFTTTSGGSIYIFNNTSTNATSYMWDFGDGNTSTDVSPSHVYAGVDSTYTVQLIATNACGSDTINVVVTTVDVPENLEARGLNIYPNPVNENLTLDFGLLIGEDININIFDIQGRVLISDQINGESGAFQKVISVNSLTDGIYFVRIATNDEIITKKIVKN
jgi:parallel beta-helix repeat protein